MKGNDEPFAMPLPLTTPGPSVVAANGSLQDMPRLPYYNRSQCAAIRGMAKSQLAMGLCLIILGTIYYIYYSIKYYGYILPFDIKSHAGTGIGCGLALVVAGIFGVVAERSNSLCTIGTYAVLNIISALFTVVVIAIWGDSFAKSLKVNKYRCGQLTTDIQQCHVTRLKLAIGSLSLVFGILQFFISIICLAISCASLRRKVRSSNSVLAPQNTEPSFA